MSSTPVRGSIYKGAPLFVARVLHLKLCFHRYNVKPFRFSWENLVLGLYFARQECNTVEEIISPLILFHIKRKKILHISYFIVNNHYIIINHILFSNTLIQFCLMDWSWNTSKIKLKYFYKFWNCSPHRATGLSESAWICDLHRTQFLCFTFSMLQLTTHPAGF